MALSEDVIAILVPTLQGGGAERVASRLSQYFSATHRVLLITWDGRLPAYEFGGQLIDLNLPASSAFLGKARRQWQRHQALASVLKEHGVSRAIAFMESTGVPLAMVKSRLMPRLMATVSMRCSPIALGSIARLQVKRWYPRVDRVVMQTRASVEQVVQWGLPSERCVVIPNPMPSDLLVEITPASARDPDLIVAIGRLDPVKDFDLMLLAFARISRPKPPRLVILGDGEMRQALISRAAALGVGDRVEIRGHVTDVKSWLDRAGIFVMSSRHEGFPNALAEAMARGCPVISTECPTGPGEMIEHGRSGWLVPVGDAAALANAMTEALLDRRRAESFGRAARLRAEEWSIDRIAPLWLRDA